jgi:hypothetical protein
MSQGIAATWRLYFDDIGAEVGKQSAAEIARDNLAQV